MSHHVGVWIDHKRAVIVSIVEGQVTTSTLESEVGSHPHYAGSQEGGGEKKYEEKHDRRLIQYYDEVVTRLGQPDAILLFGPGEAKQQLQSRLGRAPLASHRTVTVESADRLTEPQIVAAVKAHFDHAR